MKKNVFLLVQSFLRWSSRHNYHVAAWNLSDGGSLRVVAGLNLLGIKTALDEMKALQ